MKKPGFTKLLHFVLIYRASLISHLTKSKQRAFIKTIFTRVEILLRVLNNIVPKSTLKKFAS